MRKPNIIYLLADSYVGGLPVLSGWLTICIVVFAVMIPAGPAFLGPFEIGFVLGLKVYGVDRSISAVVAIVAHVLTIVFFALFVGIGFLGTNTKKVIDGS